MSENKQEKEVAPPPPPGFEDVKAGAHLDEVAQVAEKLAKGEDLRLGTKKEGTVDAPDLSLKTGQLKSWADEEAETEAIIKVADPNSKYTSAQTFDELGLSAELLQGLYTEMKFEKPSKIQAETLPMILTPPHRNLIAQAHNGSGKTTCFTLGILSRVNVNEPGTQGLMICPTRELVIQNVGVMQRMGKYTNISIASTADPKYDGYNKEQINGQVVIGTPGRLLRWMREKQLDCSKVNCLVFDEADNMLGTDGHRVDSTKILKHLQMSAKKLASVVVFGDI